MAGDGGFTYFLFLPSPKPATPLAIILQFRNTAAIEIVGGRGDRDRKMPSIGSSRLITSPLKNSASRWAFSWIASRRLTADGTGVCEPTAAGTGLAWPTPKTQNRQDAVLGVLPRLGLGLGQQLSLAGEATGAAEARGCPGKHSPCYQGRNRLPQHRAARHGLGQLQGYSPGHYLRCQSPFPGPRHSSGE